MDYTKLTDEQVKEIRQHWRREESSTQGGFEYRKKADAIEAEAKRRGL